MKFTTFTTLVYPLLSILSLVVFAAPLESRDVFVPKITYPTKGTVWVVGESYNVTWDVSNAPQNITNKVGEIHLRQHGLTSPNTLASNFSILLGTVEITVPQVSNGSYKVVLIGDSGDFSPRFTIVNN